MRWYPFDPARGYRQKRPPEKRVVLCCIPQGRGLPPVLAAGYRKNHAGEKSEPYFVIPGLGGVPTAWCDCLPDAEASEFWGTQNNSPKNI